MTLNVGLDVSFDNMQDCKRIREKAGEVNKYKSLHMTRLSDEFLRGVKVAEKENG